MIELSALWLMFVLGMRHALDPDHVAVIDNIVFRTIDARPRLAPWTGTFFALGHSLSVAAVAVGVSLAAGAFTMPDWLPSVVDVAVVLLLLAVGTMNLLALLRRDDYTPVGWRRRFVPKRLRESTHPLAICGVGIVFGLVFDTATQAAAWGAAATAAGGTSAALIIAGTFASGMLIADTLDSQIVGRLLRSAEGSAPSIRLYKRVVGWLVVGLSFGVAGYAIAEAFEIADVLPDHVFSALGISAAAIVVALLATGHLMERSHR